MVTLTSKGSFKKSKTYFGKLLEKSRLPRLLEHYGEEGVKALSEATPVDSGKTANSWYYTVTRNENSAKIVWSNSNVSDGIPVAILIQYGHQANGVYVEGRDFINPAMAPILDEISKKLWEEVANL